MAQNYKETLNLPRTDFPMKANLAVREPEMLARWEKERVYDQIQDARADAELFVLHDGPPFANGDVHMGTALNKVLKDMIVKSRTMFGFRAPYVPGWDCHGLPIEFKVVKEARGLAPAEVRKRCEEFARKFVDIQREQFKRLAVFGDWEHPYLTMNPSYEADILRAFADFVELGLVYESKKPVFWSTGAQTALAVAEVEYHDREDTAVYVKFPIVTGELAGKSSVAIWTTTPWTLPANVAIAVHPNELYVRQEFLRNGISEVLVLADRLVDKFCLATGFEPTGEPLSSFPGSALTRIEAQHPFLPRRSIILPAEYVTMDTGTGAVHTAPGHGEDDYSLGREFKLDILSPVDDHGRFTDEAGIPELVGKYVFDANAAIVAILGERGALLASEAYQHSYPYCWRSKTPIIFRAVEQFFIRLDELRGKALDAITKATWIPAWGENRIAGTVESRPDWVISRQRSWGVPLPVFYNAAGQPLLRAEWIRRLAELVAKRGSNVWFELNDDELARELQLPAGLTKRNDTIDVWIDSGLSHKAVCAARPELHDPADVYIEATDQHRGWFQSSLMTSVALHNRAPYKTCITHGFVVDVDGKKISKSSSYEKPMDAMHFVNKHGADILRLWVSSVNYTDDVPFSEEMFTRLGDTYRRIRNTLRILHGNLFDFEPRKQESTGNVTLVDRWILSRLDDVIADCRSAYERYEFHKVYHTINDFCAVDLSSLYIDITKDRMYCDAPDSARRRATQAAMCEIYDALCRLLAPVLAFTAEEAWQYLGATASVHAQLFPDPAGRHESDAVNAMNEALALREEVTRELEQARQQKIVGNSLEAKVCIELPRNKLAYSWFDDVATLEEILILSDLRLVDGVETKAVVGRTDFAKCARCWRHRDTVGKSDAHPELCDRCEVVVSDTE
jgi:isoleucyl-tRNA synthetase